MLIGYARISKADGSQSLDLQRDALREAGVSDDAIYEDQASGQREDRPGLAAWHCHVNRVGPQRPAWIPFQAAALALSHTLNASFRNRLNVSPLHK